MSRATYFFLRSPSAGKDSLEGKFASESANAKTSGEPAIPLTTPAGRYWFVEVPGYKDRLTARSGLHVLSTEEIAVVLDGGRQATAISGPFRTREEAEQSFERYWEMILDHDDD